MNNFFENHLDEIKLITTRSKKESRKSFSRLQKATEYVLKTVNGKICANEIKTIEGINVHQVTDEGKVLLGSSDRVYLPDVATRLYQGLDNILKSYKSHKVHDEELELEYPAENNSRIEYVDLADWENSYLIDTVNNLFTKISSEAKSYFDIEINLDGIFSLWNIYNPNSKIAEFDEFYLVLNYKIYDKEKDILLFDKYKRITNSELRNKRINLDFISDFIESLVEIVKKETADSKKINPDLILFSNSLTSKLLLFLLSRKSQFESQFKNLKEFTNANLMSESFDHFGNELEAEKNLEKASFATRQYKFHSKVHEVPRNLSWGEVENLDNPFEKDIKEMLLDVSKKHKGKNLVYIISTNSIHSSDFDQSFIINPTLALYFDGKEFKLVNIDLIEIKDFDELQFSDEKFLNLQKHNDLDLYIGLNSPAHSYIAKEKVIIA